MADTSPTAHLKATLTEWKAELAAARSELRAGEEQTGKARARLERVIVELQALVAQLASPP